MPLWSMRCRRQKRGRTVAALRRRTTCACRLNQLIAFLIPQKFWTPNQSEKSYLNKDENKYEDRYGTDGEKDHFYDAVTDELAAPSEIYYSWIGPPVDAHKKN